MVILLGRIYLHFFLRSFNFGGLIPFHRSVFYMSDNLAKKHFADSHSFGYLFSLLHVAVIQTKDRFIWLTQHSLS